MELENQRSFIQCISALTKPTKLLVQYLVDPSISFQFLDLFVSSTHTQLTFNLFKKCTVCTSNLNSLVKVNAELGSKGQANQLCRIDC